MRSRPTADVEAMKFRAPTLEEAVAIAEDALGGRVKVLEANRIRRGGIGGFFATDLGVEVAVLPEDESIDEALERLVAESDADERSHWQRRTSSRSDEASLSPSPVRLDPEMLVPEPTGPELSMSALRAMASLTLQDQPEAPSAPRRPRLSFEPVSTQHIVDELRVLAERDAASVVTPEVVTPPPVPSVAPRPRKLASPATDRPVAAVSATPIPKVAPVATPAPTPVATPVATPAPTPVATRTERVVRGDDGPAVISSEIGTSALEVVVPSDVAAVAARRSTAAPSRRHVELTIAAADQLIDSLSRNGSAQRLSVRVILRTGDQREVEAEAHWEAPIAIEHQHVTEVG